MIVPTVGRVVWFWENDPNQPAQSQPHAALVTYVHSDAVVNLAVFDAEGNLFPRRLVRLNQDDDLVPVGMYCEWMPYQKQVASGAIAAVQHAPATSPFSEANQPAK